VAKISEKHQSNRSSKRESGEENRRVAISKASVANINRRVMAAAVAWHIEKKEGINGEKSTV